MNMLQNFKSYRKGLLKLGVVVVLAGLISAHGFHQAQVAHQAELAAKEETASLEKTVNVLNAQIQGLQDQVKQMNEMKTELETRQQEVDDLAQQANELKNKNDALQKSLNKLEKTSALSTQDIDRIQNDSGEGPRLDFKVTAYSAFCKEGCNGITATGYNIKDRSVDHRVIATDPRVIPMGSLVEIEGYGYFKAVDTGGAIKGRVIDLLMKDDKEANKFGVKHISVRVVRKGNENPV